MGLCIQCLYWLLMKIKSYSVQLRSNNAQCHNMWRERAIVFSLLDVVVISSIHHAVTTEGLIFALLQPWNLTQTIPILKKKNYRQTQHSIHTSMPCHAITRVFGCQLPATVVSYVGFVVDKVALGQVIFKYFTFLCFFFILIPLTALHASVILSMLYIPDTMSGFK
jgi:hypothetical protein